MTVRVRREKPDQRRHHRVTAPLFLRVGDDGPVVRAKDWSLGGLRVDGYEADLPKTGSALELSITLPFQGFDISFVAQARVVRVVPNIQSFAVEFTEIGERELSLMHHFIEDLVRGSMSEVADQIQRIDVPVTPVSTEPDEDNKLVVKEKKLPVRQIVWVAAYAAIGFVVFGYMALVLYSNIFRMEVQTAVVSSPIIEVKALGDGQISFVRADEGAPVRRGETVIYFADHDLERQIDMARLEIQREEARLNMVMQTRANELEKITEYTSVGINQIEKMKIEVEAARAEYQSAHASHERVSKLFKRGYSTRPKLEEAAKWLRAARAKLKVQRTELKEQMRIAEAGFGKRHFNGREFVGKLDEANVNLKQARYRLALAHQSHEALLKHRERLAVHAPFDGRLMKLPRPQMSPVKQGEVIAVFEKDEDRKVVAYLTQEEVIKIGLGDTASVYFPSLNQSMKAKVVAIDRTKGFQVEIGRKYSWRSPEDRTAEVSLAFEPDQDKSLRDEAKPGLPAVVLFESRSTSPILAAMWRKVASLLM